MPVLLTSAASIAVILKKLSNSSEKPHKLDQEKAEKLTDLGEKIEKPHQTPAQNFTPDSLFTELMGNSKRKPAVQSESESEEEIIVVKRRKKYLGLMSLGKSRKQVLHASF